MIIKTCKRANTISQKRQVRHLMYGENAKASIGTLYKGCEIYGLTKGQFCVINIIEEILKQIGKADVIISTWTAANAEIRKAEEFLKNQYINKLHFIVDRSFETRQKSYYELLMNTFGNIVSKTDSHAKFVLMGNNEWHIVIRTSMNLNENKRLENFEISDDKELYNYLALICQEIMGVDYSYFQFQALGGGDVYNKYRPQCGDEFNFKV